METNPELTIILPAYNEGAVLGKTVERLRAVLSGVVPDLEILVVDDASSDGTAEVCQGLALSPDFRCLRLPVRQGKEASLRLGLRAARGRLVAVMDADLQHTPETLVAMLERLRQGDVQVVHGVKRAQPMPSFVDQCRAWFHGRHRVDGREVQGDFKILGPEALAGLLKGTRRLFFRNAVEELNLPSATVSFSVPARPAGTTKWGFLRLVGYALGLVADASPVPLLVAGLAGLGLALVPAVGVALAVASLPLLPWWLAPLLLAIFLSDGVTLLVVGMKVYRQRLVRAINPGQGPSSGPGPSAGATPHSR